MTRYVVAGVDGSGDSRMAAQWAAAGAVRRGLALRLVTVVPPMPKDRPGALVHGDGPAREIADGIVRAHPGLDVVASSIEGEPVRVLTEIAQGTRLLVLGRRGTGGFNGLRMGSVALAVAGAATCSVVLVPVPDEREPHEPEVVVGVDARHPDDRALDAAFETAALRGVRLRVLHAWDLPPVLPRDPFGVLEEERAEREDQEVQLLLDVLHSRQLRYPEVGVLPDVRLLGAADALVRASATADLLVVGRGPRIGSHLGGVTHAAAHHSHCPVLLAPRH